MVPRNSPAPRRSSPRRRPPRGQRPFGPAWRPRPTVLGLQAFDEGTGSISGWDARAPYITAKIGWRLSRSGFGEQFGEPVHDLLRGSPRLDVPHLGPFGHRNGLGVTHDRRLGGLLEKVHFRAEGGEDRGSGDARRGGDRGHRRGGEAVFDEQRARRVEDPGPVDLGRSATTSRVVRPRMLRVGCSRLLWRRHPHNVPIFDKVRVKPVPQGRWISRAPGLPTPRLAGGRVRPTSVAG